MTLTALRDRLKLGNRFIRGSIILTVGMAMARVLGLGFSLLLGNRLTADDYGSIQYAIALAGVLTSGTMPIFQHLIARELASNTDDPTAQDRVYTNGWMLLYGVFALTVIIGVPLFALTDRLQLGEWIIFSGVTIYYCYFGTARGFESSTRLSIVFIAANALQIILVAIVYVLLQNDDPFYAIIIWGLSYIPPITFMLFFSPLRVRFRIRMVNFSVIRRLFLASIPLWISQVVFALSIGADIFLLSQFFSAAVVGAYTFTRTLNIMFDFVPTALGTTIMPRIAAIKTRRGRFRLIFVAMASILGANVLIGIPYLLLYEWGITTFFRPEYLLPVPTVILMAFAQTIAGMYGVLASVLIGAQRSSIEVIGRVVSVIFQYASGLVLIPFMGIDGAIVANIISVVTAVGAFIVAIRIGRILRQRSPSAA